MAKVADQKLNDAGTAKIKAEFLIQDHVRAIDLNFVSTKDQKKLCSEENRNSLEPPRKKLKGQNKHRPYGKKTPMSEKLCFKLGKDGYCTYEGKCCYSHDVKSYMEKKPPDIGPSCYMFDTFGKCPYSFSCRFGSQHIKDETNLVNKNVSELNCNKFYRNFLPTELITSLRKKNYNFSKSEHILAKYNCLYDRIHYSARNKSLSTINPLKDSIEIKVENSGNMLSDSVITVKDACETQVETNSNMLSDISTTLKDASKMNFESDGDFLPLDITATHEESKKVIENSEFSTPSIHEDTIYVEQKTEALAGTISDDTSPLVPENKKIDFKNKLYLAPLTTVGNLPFRRICKEFGADITCSEMTWALSLLQGQLSEWALLKRHHTEDIFGIQLCGAHPDLMTRVSQLLSETVSFDFLDLNLGCPLDGIYKKGAGCGLMNRLKKLEGIVYSVSSMIDVPLTLKMRTGIYGNDPVAHNVIKKIHEWKNRVSLITLHGRSREQRYTKSADWDYIRRCNELANPIPLFGNGDILSYEDYNLQMQESGVSGIMIARGALIKPWIFKEIKDQKHWDISSSERFDILKKYSNYAMEQWGTDTQGVEKTRRFLLEWLSFLYRYIPVGLLEHIPQRINERPPAYCGRDDLETLMASPCCSDWVKISEMLLGPVPEDFVFLPKHKANAYK